MNADLNYDTLLLLQREHPAWRLLRSDHAPLVVAFLNRVFIRPNIRAMSEPDLAELLEDELYGLRQMSGTNTFPRSARDYLNDWASSEKGWLRKYYLHGTDDAHFDLVPATERVISWIGDLEARAFVGTESRLLTLFELLRQMVTGSEADPALRVAELQKRRDEIDAEISLVLAGEVPLLDDTAMRDRFRRRNRCLRLVCRATCGQGRTEVPHPPSTPGYPTSHTFRVDPLAATGSGSCGNRRVSRTRLRRVHHDSGRVP